MSAKARKRHTRKQRRRVASVLKWGPESVARHRLISGRTGSAHHKKNGTRIATTEGYIDYLEHRVAFLEGELQAAQHSVFRKRKEIRNQRRWIERWKTENPKAALRAKELENLRSKLARVRFNGEQAASERDTLRAGLEAEVELLGSEEFIEELWTAHQRSDVRASLGVLGDRLQAVLYSVGGER